MSDEEKKLGRPKTLSAAEKADKRVVTYLNEYELDKIKEIAKSEERTNSYILRQAVQEFIKNK
ncbi:ribbon-helix-helix protein, CopG family [Arcobacter sp. YIC-310]|uniref:ribbon-helix-helix protein, CopG family n=1 Tax=Arcobacter sp. YIC-310 TaxID=3376632 RepID=UPI003C179F7C